MDYTEYTLIKKWKKEMYNMLSLYGDIDKKEVYKKLDKIIKNNLKNSSCYIYNNYAETTDHTNLLDVTEFIYQRKPIICASGVMFKQHRDEVSPLNLMTSNFIKKRKEFKGVMYDYLNEATKISVNIEENPSVSNMDTLRKEFDKNMYEFKRYDRLQILEKVKANSIYGASGLRTSVFYNLHTAVSTTVTGQVLISTSAMAFESFLENNVLFYNMDECITFIHNIKSEDREYDDNDLLDQSITVDDVYEKLESTFTNKEDMDEKIIRTILNRLSQTDLNRVYYKNNIYEFLRNKNVKKKLLKILNKVNIFRDPNEVPKDISNDLLELYDILKEYVLYNYEVYDRINRLKYLPRRSTVTIDTDSNFVNLDWWYRFVLDEILEDEDYKILNKSIIAREELEYITYYEDRELDDNEKEIYEECINIEKELKEDVKENKFKIINVMCSILTYMIKDVLLRYTTNANIQDDEKKKLINMKNEYLLDKLVLTTSKKNYASIQLLKEGVEIPEKDQMDVKGLDIMKSTITVPTQKKLKHILEDFILKPTKISLPAILRELERFENEIYEDLKLGGLQYLKPCRVSELESYVDPMREQGVKAVIIWNELYPRDSISLPDKVLILKLKINKLDDLIALQNSDIELFNKIKDNIYNNDLEKIRTTGLSVIALPQSLDNIPEWLIPYIDYDTIINDSVGKFEKILYSLGLKRINANSKVSYYSNIIEF